MDADDAREGTPPALRKAFGVVLRELRRDKGISQEQLGFEAGYHRTYISLLERGIKSPSLGAIFRLAHTLSVAPAEIVRRVDEALDGVESGGRSV